MTDTQTLPSIDSVFNAIREHTGIGKHVILTPDAHSGSINHARCLACYILRHGLCMHPEDTARLFNSDKVGYGAVHRNQITRGEFDDHAQTLGYAHSRELALDIWRTACRMEGAKA